MPRQPLLPVYKKLTYRFTPDSLLLRPDFATVIGQCVALWTQTEVQMGYLLSAIMHSNTEAAVAVFMSIRNSKAQRDAMTAAAEATLTGDNFDLFGAILNFYRSVETQRNDLAHGIFGHCDENSEVIVWIDPKHQTQLVVKLLAALKRAEKVEDVDLSDDAMNRATYVYRLKDIKSVLEDIQDVYNAVFKFAAYLREPEAPLCARLFRQIYELSQIQRELEMIRKGRKTESEAPR